MFFGRRPSAGASPEKFPRNSKIVCRGKVFVGNWDEGGGEVGVRRWL